MTTVTKQMLIDAIATKGVPIVGADGGNLDRVNPRYGELQAVGSYPARLDPGTLEKYDAQGRPAAGFGPWVEVSTTSLTDPGNAKLYLTGTLFALWADGTWTKQVEWGGTRGWAAHLFAWADQRGTVTESTAPTGWGSTDQNGARFMDVITTWIGPERLRIHGWPLSYTNVNGFFWTSINPGSDTGLADRAKLAKLIGLVHVAEIQVVGDQPAVAAAKYAVSVGWDLFPENVNRANPPQRPGSGSGFRLVKNGSVIVTSSLSRQQIDQYAATLPGYSTSTPTPPLPPPDVKHNIQTRVTTELLVDGAVVSTTPGPLSPPRDV